MKLSPEEKERLLELLIKENHIDDLRDLTTLLLKEREHYLQNTLSEIRKQVEDVFQVDGMDEFVYLDDFNAILDRYMTKNYTM